MPEHLRTLIVILVLSSVVFMLVGREANSFASSPATHLRRRNLWIGLTIVAFFSHSFWIYVVIAGMVLIVAGKHEKNPLALFWFLLFLIPAAPAQISGLGLINYLFELNHIRLLAIALLLPAFFKALGKSSTARLGSFTADRLLLLYLVLVSLLFLRQTTLTDTLRHSLYLFLDVFLPYYIASRCLQNLHAIKEALFYFWIAGLLLAVIGIFEMNRHWLLYTALLGALDLSWTIGQLAYLGRGDMLRASATAGQAIALGYAMAVTIGIYLYLRQDIRSRLHAKIFSLLLAVGLIAPLSRGPWVGMAALLVCYISLGKQALRNLTLLALAVLLSLPLISILPGGEKIINLLPFVGNVEKENITYRENLLDNALIVIERNPWFGSVDYLKTPEMEAMRQGQGIIDIVNSYIAIALQQGIVGLLFFTSFFAVILLGLRRALRTIKDTTDEYHRLGRCLFATLVGILVIIFTVSSITIIPIVYWSFAGLCVAYIRLVNQREANNLP